MEFCDVNVANDPDDVGWYQSIKLSSIVNANNSHYRFVYQINWSVHFSKTMPDSQ